ncbi:hypothetical protein HMPREF3037_01127 [Candidatus Stoquefichus sp. KLE1796]|nr:hypothetical protein HMPREF3037_01127 [Candidatus Stoquefichus sp. KLE1796]
MNFKRMWKHLLFTYNFVRSKDVKFMYNKNRGDDSHENINCGR